MNPEREKLPAPTSERLSSPDENLRVDAETYIKLLAELNSYSDSTPREKTDYGEALRHVGNYLRMDESDANAKAGSFERGLGTRTKDLSHDLNAMMWEEREGANGRQLSAELNITYDVLSLIQDPSELAARIEQVRAQLNSPEIVATREAKLAQARQDQVDRIETARTRIRGIGGSQGVGEGPSRKDTSDDLDRAA